MHVVDLFLIKTGFTTQGSLYKINNLYGSSKNSTGGEPPVPVELLDNDSAFLLDNDGVHLLDNK